MSSDSDDLSSDSNSSSISSNSIEYHEWESRVVQYNQRTDHIFEDVIINYHNLFIQDQTSRARRAYRDREREQGEALLMAGYFVDNPTFDEVIFRRRFCMRKHLFVCIVDVVTANNAYFQQRRDATGRKAFIKCKMYRSYAGVAMVAMTASIGSGKIILKVGLDNTQEEMESQPSFWKPLRHMTYGLETCNLEHHVRAMILTFSKSPIVHDG
ncbi:hypothetical protein Tco_0996955 [Tanacetum coccineum]